MVYKVDTLREHFDPAYKPDLQPAMTKGRRTTQGDKMGTVQNIAVAPGAGGNLAHSPTNDPEMLQKQKWDALMTTTRELGVAAGRGKDVLIRHMLAITQAAFEGVIDNTENKHGNGVDDATRITEEYWRAQNKEVIFDPKAQNQKTTISKVRQCITLGGWSKGGPGEPIAMVNQAMTLYKKMRQEPNSAKRMLPADGYLVLIARKMKKSDQVLGLDELRDLAYKPTPEVATIEDRLSAIRKELLKMRDGKHNSGALAEADTVIKPINRILKGIADAKKAVETADQQEPTTAGEAAPANAA